MLITSTRRSPWSSDLESIRLVSILFNEPSLWHSCVKEIDKAWSGTRPKKKMGTNNCLLWLGYKLCSKALRNGQSKLLIIANNCPAIRKTQLEYMAILANSDVIHYEGNNVELGKSPLSLATSIFDINFDALILISIFTNRNCSR